MNAIASTVDLVIKELDEVRFGFVDASYSNGLRDTYVRTVTDVTSIIQKSGRVLEIGAFTGVVSLTLNRLGYDVTAHDIPLVIMDPEMQVLLHSNRVSTVCFNLQNTPYDLPDAAFDAIICCEVLEHLAFNPIPVVRELKRILKPGGVIYIATPNFASLVHRLALLKGRSFNNSPEHFVWALNSTSAMSVGLHWKEYTKRELLMFFELEGMRCVRHYYCRYVNRTMSSVLRRILVACIYRLFPSLMQCQVATFTKN